MPGVYARWAFMLLLQRDCAVKYPGSGVVFDNEHGAHAHLVWCLDQALRRTRERRRESRISALLLIPPSLLLDQRFQVRLLPGTQQKQAIASQEQVANQAANPIPGAAQDGGNGPAVQDREIWDQISAGMKDD